MRPTKLVISAFGSYAKETVINMDVLGESGLYMITGRTGAGKTTIFDAISFALFGQVSGKTRGKEGADALRCRQADERADTFVELEFMYSDKLYKIKRNPEYRRLKKGKSDVNGDKYIKKAASCEVILPDGKVIVGVKESNAKIKEIIGLDYDQFLQIVMLAQGDFQRLLTSGSADKTKIFRSIFHTEKYENIIKIFKEKRNRARDLYDELKGKLSDEIKKLDVDSADITDIKKAGGDVDVVAAYEEISRVTAAADKELVQLNRLAEEKNKELKDINKNLAVINEVNSLFTKISAGKEKIGKLKEEKNILEEKKKELFSEIMKKRLKDLTEKIEEETAKLRIYLEYEELEREVNLSVGKEKKLEEEYKKEKEAREGEIKKLEVSLKASREELDLARKRYDKAYDSFISAQAGILARDLKEGEPCPVCGSKSHPHPAPDVGGGISKESLDKIKNKRNELEESILRLTGQLNKLMSSPDNGKLDELKKLKAENEINKERIEKLKKDLQYENYREAERGLAALKKEKDRIETNRAEAEKSLSASIAAIKENEGSLKSLLKEAEGKSYIDDKELKIKEVETENAFLDIRKKREKIISVNAINKSVQKAFAAISRDFLKAEKDLAVYQNLFDTVVGNTGDEKINIETFVQITSFDNVIKRANQKLLKMTENRYTLERDTAAGRGAFKGLDLNVTDNYNDRKRSVNTLSGGELFKAALSLALGLSEEVSEKNGGIKIDTLFIDEGFGGLDRDSLDQAIRVLQSVSKEGRLIGIISHVQELRTMIEKKIIVTKDKISGASSIEIVTE